MRGEALSRCLDGGVDAGLAGLALGDDGGVAEQPVIDELVDGGRALLPREPREPRMSLDKRVILQLREVMLEHLVVREHDSRMGQSQDRLGVDPLVQLGDGAEERALGKASPRLRHGGGEGRQRERHAPHYVHGWGWYSGRDDLFTA